MTSVQAIHHLQKLIDSTDQVSQVRQLARFLEEAEAEIRQRTEMMVSFYSLDIPLDLEAEVLHSSVGVSCLRFLPLVADLQPKISESTRPNEPITLSVSPLIAAAAHFWASREAKSFLSGDFQSEVTEDSEWLEELVHLKEEEPPQKNVLEIDDRTYPYLRRYLLQRAQNRNDATGELDAMSGLMSVLLRESTRALEKACINDDEDEIASYAGDLVFMVLLRFETKLAEFASTPAMEGHLDDLFIRFNEETRTRDLVAVMIGDLRTFRLLDMLEAINKRKKMEQIRDDFNQLDMPTRERGHNQHLAVNAWSQMQSQVAVFLKQLPAADRQKLVAELVDDLYAHEIVQKLFYVLGTFLNQGTVRKQIEGLMRDLRVFIERNSDAEWNANQSRSR